MMKSVKLIIEIVVESLDNPNYLVKLSGIATFYVKELLKKMKFIWNKEYKCWYDYINNPDLIIAIFVELLGFKVVKSYRKYDRNIIELVYNNDISKLLQEVERIVKTYPKPIHELYYKLYK